MVKRQVEDKAWRQINKAGKLTKHLQQVGERIAGRADRISSASGGTAKHTVRSGTRPGGRAFTDVVTDNPYEEFGTDDVKRIGALRKAVRGG